MTKTYLRELKIYKRYTLKTKLEIFTGDIKEDKEYWVNNSDLFSIKYFKLTEVEK